MRAWITTALEVAGLAAMSAAAWMVDSSLGVAAAGASMIVVGVTEGRK